jgi:hypothetical protein
MDPFILSPLMVMVQNALSLLPGILYLSRQVDYWSSNRRMGTGPLCTMAQKNNTVSGIFGIAPIS